MQIDLGRVTLTGDLTVPLTPLGLVLFAHGSGSSRLSPRNRAVAATLQEAGIATLLFDLLTEREDRDPELRFAIDLLAERLGATTQWVAGDPRTRDLQLGYFGASTGAAAALKATVRLGSGIRAIVSRGGRPDLAEPDLPRVQAPTLLIVGENDRSVLALNRQAYDRLGSIKQLEVVPGATHLFEERGALERVAELAGMWFEKYLPAEGVSKDPSVSIGPVRRRLVH